MNLQMQNSDWVTLSLASLGAIWLALIVSGMFTVVFQWLYAKIKRFDIPDTIPEMFPE